MTTPSRAAILTLDELQSQFERLKAKAESFAITGELDRARAVARQALRARDTAEHFAKSEGLR
jgi:phage I-like protein